MDRLAPSVDRAFRSALSGDFDSIDALIAREKALLTPYDRLNHLQAEQRAYALAWGMMPARSKEDARWIKAHHEKHAAAAKCLRRRIDRLVKRGVL